MINCFRLRQGEKNVNTTFEILLTDDEYDPYVARELRPVNDGDAWRDTPLMGSAKSLYGAIAKLCFLSLEMQGKTEEIFSLFKYYSKLYPQAARQAVEDNSS